MNALLLVAVLMAGPTETVYVFVQDNCPPCEQDHAANGTGDGQLRLEYINVSHGPMPQGLTSTPSYYSPRTKRWEVGRRSMRQLKAWLNVREPLASGAAAHTPHAEVVRVINLLPKPQMGFVDYGCGYDARWCVVAAEKWGCRVTGVEIDHDRAEAARQRVQELGLSHLITIVEADATQVDVQADVGVAYLYPEVLYKLKPRIQKLKVFASYLHQPPELQVHKNGDTFLYYQQYVQPVQTQPVQRPAAVWGGHYYQQPVCNSPNCAMCNAIRAQLGDHR